MLGLLAGLERKNCWTIAEHRGGSTSDGLQHLLSRAKWNADLVRDDVRGYVVEAFGDPDAVLIVDETGDLKKGRDSVGVQRQYTGTAGRIENAQVAVYLTYAAPRGHALIDRSLYLPQSWIDDRSRCVQAGIPDDVGFATKPALAVAMIDRALEAGVPAAWVTGDEVYGSDSKLRRAVEQRGLDMCWLWPATIRSSRPPESSPPLSWPPGSGSPRGRSARLGRVVKARGGTPGPSPRSSKPGQDSGGCCCAATTPPGS